LSAKSYYWVREYATSHVIFYQSNIYREVE